MDNKQKKINKITSEIKDFMYEYSLSLTDDKSALLNCISSIICELDTDIAIKVMENFEDEGKKQALSIKINYGY